jgi:hypothetical protein
MARAAPTRPASLKTIAKVHYCVVGPDGAVSEAKLALAVAALKGAGAAPKSKRSSRTLPTVQGVPRLVATLDKVPDIPGFVRKYLPEVAKNPRLHALSFVNPLKLATDELGIAISPAVARYIRRLLRGSVSFADAPQVPGSLTGITRIRWVASAPSSHPAKRTPPATRQRKK